MIPGVGAGKGDSPRAVDHKTYGNNFKAINWRKGEPKDKPWLIKPAGSFRGDPYAGLNIHQRILKTYYDKECAGTLKPDRMHRRFAEAHKSAQDPSYYRRSNERLARMKDQ